MPVDFSLELRLAYLRAAHAGQKTQEDKIKQYREFYGGEQGLILTDRQKEYILTAPESLGNICKRVVNVPKDRLLLEDSGIAAASDDGQAYADTVTDWWQEADLGAMQKEVYSASLRDGQTAIIVDYDIEEGRPKFVHNLVYDGAAGLVRFHYDQDDNLMFASKRWNIWNPLVPGETGKSRLTVYRPDLIERYEADSAAPDGWRFIDPAVLGMPNPQTWTMDGTPSGEPIGIPVIPFEPDDGSELEDVIVIQELLNHSLSTFDRSTDYHGWPLLYTVNGNFGFETDGTPKFPNFDPGTGINLAEGGSAGRIEPADLQKLFQSGVLSWLQMLAIIKGWPLHLLDRSQQPPSGVALQIMEGSLVAHITDIQAQYGGAWRKAFDIARRLHQIHQKQELPGELELTWKSPKTLDPVAEMEANEKKFTAGQIPVIQRWRELGYTMDDINDMLEFKQREDDFGLADTITPVTQ